MSEATVPEYQAYREIAVSLMIGALASTVLLESIDPRSKVGDFIFWPQHYFHYFAKFGPNNPIAPRLVFLVIVALLSLFVFFGIKISGVAVRVSRGLALPILALILPMICWVVAKRGYLGIETPFSLLLTGVCVVSVSCFGRGRTKMPRSAWLLLWTVWFSWWGYLFYSALDPINLVDPVLALFSGILWTFSLPTTVARLP